MKTPYRSISKLPASIRHLILLLASAGTATAASVTFTSVTADFDQGAPYDVAKTINGTSGDGLGWGIFGQVATNHTAVYTASAPFSGNLLSVSIPQYLGADHYAKDFRISYTTDATPTAGGSWTQLAPSVARASRGLTLVPGAANHFGPTGAATGGITDYFLVAQGSFSGVTGVRFELFNTSGNVGASANGNMVISEFVVTTDTTPNLALYAPTTSSAATYSGQPASNLTDGDTGSISHPDDGVAPGFSFTTDLQGSFAFTSLELLNRGDCCPDRLSNYRVQILDAGLTSVWSGDIRTDNSNSGFGGVDTITAGSGTGTFAGRYIRVTNLSNQDYNPQIAELRAFGNAIPEPSSMMTSLLAAGLLLVRRRRC